RLERMQQLLYSHNLNGINMEDSTKEYRNAYGGLVESLGLTNVDTMNQKTIEYKIEEENAQSIIEKIFSQDQIDKLYESIGRDKLKTIQNKISKNVIKRDGKDEPTEIGDIKMPSTSSKKPPKIITQKEKRDTVGEYFRNTLALFILFDDENDSDCGEKNVIDGLDIIKKKSELTILESKEDLCANKLRIMECYYAISYDVKNAERDSIFAEKMIKYINSRIGTFKYMITEMEKDNLSDLINIYCNIKSSFMAIKTKHHPKNKESE
ncbi:unnamed protein product, partial [marine sediment metagenome]